LSIKQKLKQIGYNRDLEISKDAWKSLRNEEHRDQRSLAALEGRDEPTYRDGSATESVELKDYRNRDFEADFVAELEHYNPDKKPLLHLLVDFPNWLWKNRVKNHSPKLK
jgi:hypothetical protein